MQPPSLVTFNTRQIEKMEDLPGLGQPGDRMGRKRNTREEFKEREERVGNSDNAEKCLN